MIGNLFAMILTIINECDTHGQVQSYEKWEGVLIIDDNTMFHLIGKFTMTHYHQQQPWLNKAKTVITLFNQLECGCYEETTRYAMLDIWDEEESNLGKWTTNKCLVYVDKLNSDGNKQEDLEAFLNTPLYGQPYEPMGDLEMYECPPCRVCSVKGITATSVGEMSSIMVTVFKMMIEGNVFKMLYN